MVSKKLFLLMGFVNLLSFSTLLARGEQEAFQASLEDIQVDADGEIKEMEASEKEESLSKDRKRIVREEILADASGHDVVRETKKNRKRIVREQKKQPQDDKKPKSVQPGTQASLAEEKEQQHTGWLRVHEEKEEEEHEQEQAPTWVERWVREEEEPLHEHSLLAAEFAENQESPLPTERLVREEPEPEVVTEQIPKAPLHKRVVREEKRRA